jgi:uncharacterized protein YqeY
MKARTPVRLAALRLLSASVKNREVELGHELTVEEFHEVAGREARRRKESIEAYEKGGRQDLVDREREELAVLEEYLPAALSDEEVERVIEAAIAESGATGPKDMGAVMKAVMGKARGQVDGAAVSARVRERLAQGSGA